jgi:hypothetical protein
MLTGGTRDVKPQLLSFVASQSGADATTTTTVALPVLRNFTTGGGRAQIVEVLKVYFDFDGVPEVDSALAVVLSTKSGGTTAFAISDPAVFAYYQLRVGLTTSGVVQLIFPYVMDLTDGAGNGFLVGTDSIFAQVFSSSTTLTNAARIKVLYRVYGAGLTEYVGIVQGQQ